ncbi:hypothetical protein MHK_001432 [Candidatus Magnetomorum sp. HK-1]|nr:hypothetical protein MHK_001432 [Candidatus Magnetomorum sp. HK-1]
METDHVNDVYDDDLIRLYEAFSKELTDYLALVEKTGGRSVEFQTAYLYSRVEGQIADTIKMLVCIRVMKDHMLPGDKVVEEPQDFDGRYLKIRFQLPRKVTEKVNNKG